MAQCGVTGVRGDRLNTNLLRLLLASVLFCFTLPVQALTDKEIDALFNEGLEILEGDDPAQAIAIFEGILRDQPDLNRVRLELALANLRAFNYAEARRQAQLVLNDPSVRTVSSPRSGVF